MRTARSDGLETRRRLLNAAESIFAAKGFHKAKTAEICRMAKANTAAVNYHFGSKEELYVEAWRNAFERSIEAYPPDGGVPATAPAEDRLRGQILATMKRIMDPASLDFDIAHREMANPTGLLAEVMHRSIDPLYQRLVGVVSELLGEDMSERQVFLCAMSIHAQCFAWVIHERRRPAGQKPLKPSLAQIGVEALADHILRFSLAGLEAIKSAPEKTQSSMSSGRVDHEIS